VLLSAQVNLYRSYQTSIPWEIFMVTTGLFLAMGVAFAFVMYGAAAALVLSFFPQSAAALRLAQRRVLGLDAGVLLLLAIGLGALLSQVAAILMDRFHAVTLLSVGGSGFIDNPAPALAAVASAVGSLFARGAILALLALVVQKLPKRWMVVPLAILAAVAMVQGEVRTPGEFALEYAVALLGVACALAFCLWFARNNYLAYTLVLGVGILRPAVAELFASGNAGLEMQAWGLVALMVAGVAWTVGPALVRR
jgi:hypothetical protein